MVLFLNSDTYGPVTSEFKTMYLANKFATNFSLAIYDGEDCGRKLLNHVNVVKFKALIGRLIV